MWRAAVLSVLLSPVSSIKLPWSRRSQTASPSAAEHGATWFGPRPIDAPGEVCFVVLTQPAYHVQRCQVIRNTWGKDAHIVGWASDKADPALPGSFVVMGSKGRDELGGKALSAFWWLMQNERVTKRCKWFGMVDDDTYVVLPRMRHFFAAVDPGYPAAYGAVLVHLNKKNATSRDIFSGGAGMVISRALMDRWKERITKVKACNYNHTRRGASDVTLSFCWRALDAEFVDVSGYHPLRMDAWFGSKWCHQTWWVPGHKDNPSSRQTHMTSCKPDPRMMTLHYVSPWDMPYYHAFLTNGSSKNAVPHNFSPKSGFLEYMKEAHHGLRKLRTTGKVRRQNHTVMSGRVLPRAVPTPTRP
eukprot:Hpha_TRINITY_DN18766_c0_g1::TRINITY_DN18766_c0_g1_i1::g.47542::m.47542/K00731/C1GALT1; glycoprotein-N-acetylgalactosamine 3-beta-galactosyltransferase